MTKQEFDMQKWRSGMECYIDGDLYSICKVDIEYRCVAIKDEEGDDLWIPYKYVTIKA